MRTNIILAVVLAIVSAAAMVAIYGYAPRQPIARASVAVRYANPHPNPLDVPGVPGADVCPLDSAACPMGSKHEPTFGANRQTIAMLAQPMRADVVLYPASGGTLRQVVDIPAGVWIVPQTVMGIYSPDNQTKGY